MTNIIPQVVDYMRHPMKYADHTCLAQVNPHTGTVYRVSCVPLEQVVPVEFLGEGAFSCAYALPDGTALKIVRGTDKPYHEFVKYAMENPDNPALPRFYEVIHVQADQHIYHMERLEVPRTDRHMDECKKLISCINADRTFELCSHVDRVIKEFGSANLNDTKWTNMGRRDEQLVFMDPTAVFKGRGVTRKSLEPKPVRVDEFHFDRHNVGKMVEFTRPRLMTFPRFGWYDIHEAAVENKELKFRHGKPIRPHDHIIGRENRRNVKLR